MATHKSARKRAIQAEKRRLRNKATISTMRTLVKKVHFSMEGKNPQEIKEQLKETTSYIDKMADKGIMHKNKASRLVSRLTTRANQLTK